MKKSKGFTLIEIGIVLFVIGILVSVFIPSYTQGAKDTARATKIASSLIKMSDAINAISQECNISISNVLYNVPDTANSKTVAHVINEGASAVVPAYQDCYRRANVAVIQVFRFNPLPTIDGISIVFSNITGKNGRPSVLFTLAGISPELVVAIMNKYAGTSLTTSTLNPAGDTLSNPVFGYTYVSTYLRLIIKPMM